MSTATNFAVSPRQSTSGADLETRQQAPARQGVWRSSIRFTILTGVVLGLVYPLIVTGVARLLFPHQASGSLVIRNGQVIGSSLIGQSFTSDRYLQPRPSNAGNGYDAAASGGANLAQSNSKLAQRVQADIDKIQVANHNKPVPIDMVTTSASGLDPDVTPDNAYYQASRIALARGASEAAVRTLIASHVTGRYMGLLGEPRVNVLELNMALDQAFPTPVLKAPALPR